MIDDASTSAKMAEASAPVSSEPQLRLLLELDHRSGAGLLPVIAASLAIHLFFFLAAVRLPSFIAPSEPERRIAVHKIPLYLPPDLLTQKARNQRPVTKSIDLTDLLSTPNEQSRRASANRSVRQFELPKQLALQTAQKMAPQILPEPPMITAKATPVTPAAGANGTLAMNTPPAPTPRESPFQNIGSDIPVNPNPTLRPPHADLRSETTGLAKGRDGHQLLMSDDNPNEASPGSPGAVGNTGERHAAVELKSDPQGADFKPYLTRILAIVRSNWKRVIPESVRSGAASGRTTVEFIINRDGQIPKMVTARSSGSTPLDRAAVAGLSMSNPLPPLPPDYKGFQVRLAFSFDYNMPSR